MANVDMNELILFCEKNTLVLSNNIQQTVGICMSVNCAPLSPNCSSITARQTKNEASPIF